VPDPQVQGLKQQVDALFKDADALYKKLRADGYPRESAVQAAFAQYLCVRVSGFVDASVGHILSKHIAHQANKVTVRRFAEIKLGKVTNLNAERLCRLLSDFDAQWRTQLETFLNVERRDALDSVVANRNNIAHGRPTTVTFSRVSEFHKRATEIIDYVDGLVPR
jgi:hypothetical protein